MKSLGGILPCLLFAAESSPSDAFALPARKSVANERPRTTLRYKNLPTVESLSTNDSFTDQTYYGSMIVRELSGRPAPAVEFSPDEKVVLPEDAVVATPPIEIGARANENRAALSELLAAQLSHRDGIRGFFAAFLSGEGETVADGENLPAPLTEAMKRADVETLAQIACMNVIMATAMTTIYSDPTLKANSAKMAKRSKKVLSSMKGSISMLKNCEAIVVVATGAKNHRANAKLVKLWKGKAYKYQEEQLRDIVIAFSDLV